MMYCFGDSITEGRPGKTYLKHIRKELKLKNYGLGGDTLQGTADRFLKMRSKIKKTDYVVLGIGTNDILIPYFISCSEKWRNIAKKLIYRGSVPCVDIIEFKNKYKQLLRSIKEVTSHCVSFGIPLIENSENNLDEAAKNYNAEIELICKEEGIPFIDFRAWQIKKRGGASNMGSFFLASQYRTIMGLVWDTVLTTYLPFESYICRKRGLIVTVDGCHLNKSSAIGLANLVSEQLDIYQK